MMLVAIYISVLSMIYSINNKHILNCIILLELMILGGVYLVLSFNSVSAVASILVMVLFAVSVSSSSLGLALIVLVSRTHGEDSFLTYNLVF